MANQDGDPAAKDHKLEYVLEMTDQLGDLADGMGEPQLRDALHATADMRRVCEPSASTELAQDGAPAE